MQCDVLDILITSTQTDTHITQTLQLRRQNGNNGY